jgi:hypothetical protein
MNPDTVRKFQKLLEGELNSLLRELYPNYMTTYEQYKKRTGGHCPFCKAGARYMFNSEFARNGQDFINRFNNDNWEGYE